jgi:transcriptional repressor NrdR
MHCPKCSSDDLKVLDTRAGKVASTRRRRECQGCGYRFSTIEEILREDLVVVKRDGRRESFDRTKLATSLRRAISKRPIDAEQINGLLSQILRQIENEFDSEVPSRAIADAIMLRLQNVDGVAWLRYASFYEDFMGISRLVEELVNLGGNEKGDNYKI